MHIIRIPHGQQSYASYQVPGTQLEVPCTRLSIAPYIRMRIPQQLQHKAVGVVIVLPFVSWFGIASSLELLQQQAEQPLPRERINLFLRAFRTYVIVDAAALRLSAEHGDEFRISLNTCNLHLLCTSRVSLLSFNLTSFSVQALVVETFAAENDCYSCTRYRNDFSPDGLSSFESLQCMLRRLPQKPCSATVYTTTIKPCMQCTMPVTAVVKCLSLYRFPDGMDRSAGTSRGLTPL